MARPTTTFLDELISAARGTFALLLGDRKASAYFDFQQIGLIGSFIALILGLAIQAFAPQLLGPEGPAGIASGVMIVGAIVIAAQFGVAWLVLRQLGRSDGFIPFAVVQNWATAFQSILAVIIFAIFGQPIALDPSGELAQLTGGSIPFLVLGLASIVVAVNIARIILTLRPLHVALFVIAQFTAALLMQQVVAALL